MAKEGQVIRRLLELIMDLTTVTGLSNLIQSQTHCLCEFVKSVRVRQVYKGRVLWQGSVGLFRMRGHPTASECFAWSNDRMLGVSSPTFVFKSESVKSASSAVRAHIRQLCDDLVAA